MFICPKSISAEPTGIENQLKDLYEKYGDIVNVVFCSIPETSKIVLEVMKEDESVNLLYSPAHLKEYLKKNNNLIRHAVIKNLKKHNNHMKVIQKIESWCLINRNISDLLRYDNMSEELIFAAFYATPQTNLNVALNIYLTSGMLSNKTSGDSTSASTDFNLFLYRSSPPICVSP